MVGRKDGLGEIDAHATAGSGDEPDLLVSHDISLAIDQFLQIFRVAGSLH